MKKIYQRPICECSTIKLSYILCTSTKEEFNTDDDTPKMDEEDEAGVREYIGW